MLVSAPWARHVVEVLHEPVPTLLAAYVLAMLLPEAGRRRYFLWITMGVGLHYSLDILQKVYGDGGQKWLFPFSWKSIQFGLFWPDQAVLFILPLLIVTGAVELCLIRARRAGIGDKSA